LTELPNDDDFQLAAQTIAGRVHRTPVHSSRTLSDLLNRDAKLKAELFQRSGSFKVRGAMNRVASLTMDERASGAVSVSSGNQAQGAALACAEAGVDVVVFMPRNASPAKVAATRGYGATVDLEAADTAEAFARMHELAARSGRAILLPYDDPKVIAGQATVGLEICADVPDLGAVLVPASGGGLVSGVALAVKAHAPDARVVAVQAEATATLRATRAPAGVQAAPTRRAGATTIADALIAPAVGELCLRACVECVDEVVHVSEEEIRIGMRFVYARAKLACEAGAAVGVAALLAGKVSDLGEGAVVAVISGGNVTAQAAAAILESA
jgi:threonine dehydratase